MAGWELCRQLPLIMYTFHTSRARYRAARAPIPEQCDDSVMNGEMRGAVRGEMVRWIRGTSRLGTREAASLSALSKALCQSSLASDVSRLCTYILDTLVGPLDLLCSLRDPVIDSSSFRTYSHLQSRSYVIVQLGAHTPVCVGRCMFLRYLHNFEWRFLSSWYVLPIG